MAKKNKEKKAKSKMEASKELTPNISNARGNCAADDRCKTDKCK